MQSAWKEGDNLTWDHGNNTSEHVKYVRPAMPGAVPRSDGSSYPSPEPMAIVRRADGRDITVPVANLRAARVE